MGYYCSMRRLHIDSIVDFFDNVENFSQLPEVLGGVYEKNNEEIHLFFVTYNHYFSFNNNTGEKEYMTLNNAKKLIDGYKRIGNNEKTITLKEQPKKETSKKKKIDENQTQLF